MNNAKLLNSKSNVSDMEYNYYVPLVSINKGNVTFFYKHVDIIYCKSEGNYSKIYLANNEVHISTKNLKELSEVLDSDFMIRVHHSYIVNVNRIKKMNVEDLVVLKMENDDFVHVSRRRKAEFLNQFIRV